MDCAGIDQVTPNVRRGSKADFEPRNHQVRIDPGNGHLQPGRLRPKSANERTRSAGGTWRRGRAITSAAVTI